MTPTLNLIASQAIAAARGLAGMPNLPPSAW
jgi:hypothetical protein